MSKKDKMEDVKYNLGWAKRHLRKAAGVAKEAGDPKSTDLDGLADKVAEKESEYDNL